MEYADRENSTGRDIMQLDELGGYYCKHVMAMTVENLHSKCDIAAELGHRDHEIDRLRRQLNDYSLLPPYLMGSLHELCQRHRAGLSLSDEIEHLIEIIDQLNHVKKGRENDLN